MRGEALEPDQVQADAIRALRKALLHGDGVADSLRGCWYRSPVFASTLFTESVRQRFGKGCDVRVITRFVSRIRSAHPVGGLNFPSREAEALIRAALGEPAMFAEVHPGEFSYPEIGIAILARLFEEWQPGRAEVESLFDRVEGVALAARRQSPKLGPAEEDWFAAGMHESPFAAPTRSGEDG